MEPSEIWPFLFDVSDVLASTVDAKTGTLLVQLGDVAKNKADSASAEAWQGASGIISRPALPTAGKASCQAFHCKRSDRDVVLGWRDLRATSIYGNLAAGETCVYATAGMARSLYKADGSARQFTTDSNAATGNAIVAGVSSHYQGTDGQPHLGGEWRYAGPWGGAWHDPTGYHLRTWHGVKIDAIGITLPAPFNATISKYRVSADSITLDASVLALGRGTPQPLVGATAMQVIMTQVATALTAMETLLEALSSVVTPLTASPSGGPVSAPSGWSPTALAAVSAALLLAKPAVASATAGLATVSSAAGTKTITGA